jgi:hypothetical protein
MIELKGQNTTAAVKLEIVLNPVLNLTLNSEQTVTTLTYNTLEDYRDGVEVTHKEHLTVFSSVPYNINVRLIDEEYLQLLGDTENGMHLPNVRISARPVNNQGNIRLEKPSLTGFDQSLIAEEGPAFHKIFDVSFHGPGDNALVDYVTDQQPAVFTNTVLYSLETR